MSCENIPIKLRHYQENVEILFLTPPDPLHVIYLGPVNDTWKCLRKYCDLKDFEKKHHMKESGPGLGEDFNGPTIKNL